MCLCTWSLLCVSLLRTSLHHPQPGRPHTLEMEKLTGGTVGMAEAWDGKRCGIEQRRKPCFFFSARMLLSSKLACALVPGEWMAPCRPDIHLARRITGRRAVQHIFPGIKTFKGCAHLQRNMCCDPTREPFSWRARRKGWFVVNYQEMASAILNSETFQWSVPVHGTVYWHLLHRKACGR